MFIVLLKFSDNKSQAKIYMTAHNAWLKQGFDDEVFIMAGSIQPQQGGAILAHNTTREALQQRVDTDPFVAENIVHAELVEISPAKADPRLSFLLQ